MRKCHCAFNLCMEGNSDVTAAWCDAVTSVRLEGPLEAVDSLAGMNSRASYQVEARTPDQPRGRSRRRWKESACRRSTHREAHPQEDSGGRDKQPWGLSSVTWSNSLTGDVIRY
jgi:hypothetical protein